MPSRRSTTIGVNRRDKRLLSGRSRHRSRPRPPPNIMDDLADVINVRYVVEQEETATLSGSSVTSTKSGCRKLTGGI